MIPTIPGDMTPALVPFGVVALVLSAMGLVGVIALIVRDQRLRSPAIVEIRVPRPAMHGSGSGDEEALAGPRCWNTQRTKAKAVGSHRPAGAINARGLDATTVHAIDEGRGVDSH